MNRRIRELMEGLFDVSVDHRGREECTADFTNIEKFAGLIVREHMTDERIAELMGWHWPTSFHPDDMLAKTRAVVHEAVNEARLDDRRITDEEINAGIDRAVLPVEMRQAFVAGVRWAEAQRGTVLDTADMEWDQESKDWMRKHFVGVEP